MLLEWSLTTKLEALLASRDGQQEAVVAASAVARERLKEVLSVAMNGG